MHMQLIAIVLLLGSFLYAITCVLVPAGDHSDHSVGWHRVHGTHRVLYPDGETSQPFTADVAKGYAAIFGGKVISR